MPSNYALVGKLRIKFHVCGGRAQSYVLTFPTFYLRLYKVVDNSICDFIVKEL